MKSLNIRALRGLFQLGIGMAAFLFLPAWTFDYWQAWVFLAVFLLSALAITVYLMKEDPKLLERRLSAGPTVEKEKMQKIIMLLASMAFVATIVLPAIDHRFSWSDRADPYCNLGQYSCGTRIFDHILRIQGKLIYSFHYHGCRGSESYIDWSVRNSTPPHVQWRAHYALWSAACARFLLGTSGVRCNRACDRVAASR
jgi:hypothetical protein